MRRACPPNALTGTAVDREHRACATERLDTLSRHAANMLCHADNAIALPKGVVPALNGSLPARPVRKGGALQFLYRRETAKR